MKKFKTYNLAMEFYRECQKQRIKNSALRDQFERASLSIVLNIAVGSGKMKPNDRRRFYSISMGSLRETQTLLQILNEEMLFQKSDFLAACLYKLIQNPGGFS